MTLKEVDRLVRATTHPYPGAYIMLDTLMNLIIWSGSASPVQSEKVLKFSDGAYYVTDFELISF